MTSQYIADTLDMGVAHENAPNKNGSYVRKAREIDLVASSRRNRTYIQSAFAMWDERRIAAETKPFSIAGDSFPKIIVRGDVRKRWYDEHGILNVGIADYLPNEGILM